MRKTDVNQITFGIEIETTVPYHVLQSAGWRIGAYHVGADIPGFTGWKTMHDGSIQARGEYTGVEVVSPVLRGAEGLREVERMVEKLHAMGAKVNQSTGFHVHVGWDGTPEQLRRLVCFVAHHEKALFASTGTTSREHNTYCSSIRSNYRAFETTATVAASRFARYHVLNLQHVDAPPTRRTVEFRVFAGTLNAIKILAYVQLCVGIVSKALDNPRKALTFDRMIPRPASASTAGAGAYAMRVLLTHLHWREKVRPGRVAAGVLDAARLPAMLKVLRKMAKQYDRRATGGGR